MTSILAKLEMMPLAVTSGGLTYPGQTRADLVKMGIPAADILVGVQAWLKDEVDRVAERLRDGLLTGGAGQALEYQAVQAEAAAALASTSPATNDFPMLAATIGLDVDPASGATAIDVTGVARAVMANVKAWTSFGAEIRGARLRGKGAIDAAAATDAAVAAFDAIAWPTPAS